MLFYLVSMLTGALIALMIAVNGALTSAYSLYLATVIIHAVGLVIITPVCLARRERLLPRERLPLWLYLGGVIGVATTVFNNLSFGRISMSALVALGLLGQAIASLLIDQFGLMGMPRRAFRPVKLSGLVCMLLGISVMLLDSPFAAMPVTVSLLAGASVVAARTVNARLAERTTHTVSTWYNYIVGLVFALITLAILGRAELAQAPVISARVWIYGGGLLGVIVVFLSNMIVTRISAFYMTLLLFIGQVFTGIAIDIVTTQSFSQQNLIGGALVAAGMALNLWLDQRKSA